MIDAPFLAIPVLYASSVLLAYEVYSREGTGVCFSLSKVAGVLAVVCVWSAAVSLTTTFLAGGGVLDPAFWDTMLSVVNLCFWSSFLALPSDMDTATPAEKTSIFMVEAANLVLSTLATLAISLSSPACVSLCGLYLLFVTGRIMWNFCLPERMKGTVKSGFGLFDLGADLDPDPGGSGALLGMVPVRP